MSNPDTLEGLRAQLDPAQAALDEATAAANRAQAARATFADSNAKEQLPAEVYERKKAEHDAAVEKALDRAERAQKELTRLHVAIRDEELRAGAERRQTAVKDVRAQQKRAQEAGQRVERIRDALSRSEATAQGAVQHEDRIEGLLQKEEVLAGQVALGEADPKELEALRAERAEAEEALRAAEAEAQNARAEIMGLRHLLAKAEADHAAAVQGLPEARYALLLAEMETLGAEYLERAREMNEAYLRMLGMERLVQRHAPEGDRPRASRAWFEYAIPAFPVAVHIAAKKPAPGVLFKAPHYGSTTAADAEDAERARLVGQGVDLG